MSARESFSGVSVSGKNSGTMTLTMKRIEISGTPRTTSIHTTQALRIAIPPLANTVISFIKESSLVMAIGLFDLLGTVQLAARDPQWLVTGTEGYLFAGAIYFALCTATAAYAAWLERRSVRSS